MSAPDPYDTSVTAIEDPALAFRRWRAWSDEFRADPRLRRDLQYGPSDAERLDLLVPRPGAPLVVFFHGGYWRRLHKDDHTFIARSLAAHGVATAVVNYALIPDVIVEDIVAQARRAVAWLRENAPSFGADPTRLVVAGHSVGGQLAGMCAVEAPVAAVVTLSGLHDLRPLMESHVQAWAQLDDARATAMSPALHAPSSPFPVIAISGERESNAFAWQAGELVRAWIAHGCTGTSATSPGDDHFTLVDRLNDPDDPLVSRIAELALNPAFRRA
jgi:arylformamidase